MKIIIYLIFFSPLVYSELHRFINTYTGINGQTTSGTPEFSAVTTLDDHQIDYYDSQIKKLIPKQDWVDNFTSTDLWKEYIKIREKLQQIYRNNIHVIMQRFTQSDGVNTYQRMYGCEWDDETGHSHGFDQYGYDGEDFISLDLKENRYITPVAQAIPTVMKWNNDRAQLRYLKQYYDYECVYWLKEFVFKATFKKTEPEVSLLQKEDSDYHTCHVTGFLFRNTIISWRKNGQALSDSSNLVESGDTLPNGDGTFQRRLTLYVHPDKWKMNQYTCVVEHKSLTETIQQILWTVKKTRRNKSVSDASYIMDPVSAIISVTALFVLIALFVLWKPWEKLKACSKKTIYFKSNPSSEPAPAQVSQDSQEPLLSAPSNKCSSLQAATPQVYRGAENLSPEASPSQFLSGGKIFTTPPDN